jgi:sugar phosphate isomerase/epimerase
MLAVLFTKLFLGRSLDDIVRVTSELGFDGIDLLIRKGHQLEPDRPEDITGAARRVAAAGLGLAMATTDITDPDAPGVDRLLGSCADAGIPLVRIGYWRYRPAAGPGTGYAAILASARRDLDGLERLAAKHRLRLAIQLHGGTIHSSGVQALALLAGHDPALLGAYPDPGNQVVQEGREDWRLTFDVLRPWLACVGIKNGGWFAGEVAPSGQRRWRADWLGLPDGMVPWDDILAALAATGFAGPLSFHGHYKVPAEQAIDQTRLDLQFVRRLVAAAR